MYINNKTDEIKSEVRHSAAHMAKLNPHVRFNKEVQNAHWFGSRKLSGFCSLNHALL